MAGQAIVAAAQVLSSEDRAALYVGVETLCGLGHDDVCAFIARALYDWAQVPGRSGRAHDYAVDLGLIFDVASA
jgi:hypothetical protein